MNFSTHQKKLIESIHVALRKDKEGLIGDFKWILSKARKLYKTSSLDFWLSEIGRHPVDDIPITRYGYSVAVDYAKNLEKCDRNSIVCSIVSICVSLFTYSRDDDMCFMQSDYHYFFFLPGNKVYKYSDLGNLSGLDEWPSDSDCRIALISDLNAEESEYFYRSSVKSVDG